MKSSMRWIALLLILCACAPLAAQDPIPDTTEAWRYFPLEVGNVWEYKEFQFQFPPCSYCINRVTVERDSIVNNIQYFLTRDVWYDFDGEMTSDDSYLLRYDGLAARVVRLEAGEESRYAPFVCSFDVPFPPEGSELQCGPDPFDNVLGVGYDIPIQIEQDMVTTALKAFAVSFVGSIRYAADIGYVGKSGCEVFCWDLRLIYAEIGDNTYGTPFPVAVEPVIPVNTGLGVSVAYPNPSNDRFSIRLSSSKPQPVGVEVFDILGRRIYSEQHVVISGESTLNLDGTSWPQGVYLVRITTADGQTATTRITRF